MSAMKIKKGDTVRVIAGKDKGKEGKVSSVDLKKNTVTVEGVNMHTKHTNQVHRTRMVASLLRKDLSMLLT